MSISAKLYYPAATSYAYEQDTADSLLHYRFDDAAMPIVDSINGNNLGTIWDGSGTLTFRATGFPGMIYSLKSNGYLNVVSGGGYDDGFPVAINIPADRNWYFKMLFKPPPVGQPKGMGMLGPFLLIMIGPWTGSQYPQMYIVIARDNNNVPVSIGLAYLNILGQRMEILWPNSWVYAQNGKPNSLYMFFDRSKDYPNLIFNNIVMPNPVPQPGSALTNASMGAINFDVGSGWFGPSSAEYFGEADDTFYMQEFYLGKY